MGIFNTVMGGGGTGGVPDFPDYYIVSSQYEGGRIYSLRSSGYNNPSYLAVISYNTTFFAANFPNVQTIEAYAFRGQTLGHFYFPTITSSTYSTILSSSAFYDAGIIHLPNFVGSFLSFASYFSNYGGFIGSQTIVDSLGKADSLQYLVCSTSGALPYMGGGSHLTYLVAYGLSSSVSYAFNGFSKLQYISIPGITTLTSQAMQQMHYLVEAHFPDCTAMGSGAFYGCGHLRKVTMPKVTLIPSSCFQNCYQLREISFPSCTSISASAFQECTRLQTVDLPRCVSVAGSAFSYCYRLRNVNLPVCKSLSSSAFYNCSSLGVVSIPTCSYIGWSVFYACSCLSKVYLTGVTAVPSLMADAFQATPMSQSTYLGYYGSIYVPKSLYNAFKTANNWSYYSARIVSV